MRINEIFKGLHTSVAPDNDRSAIQDAIRLILDNRKDLKIENNVGSLYENREKVSKMLEIESRIMHMIWKLPSVAVALGDLDSDDLTESIDDDDDDFTESTDVLMESVVLLHDIYDKTIIMQSDIKRMNCRVFTLCMLNVAVIMAFAWAARQDVCDFIISNVV